MLSKISRAPGSALLIAVLSASVVIPKIAAAELAGHVTGPSDSPVGDATIVVYTAAPKIGASSVSPSGYPDCGKSTKSDAQGNFSITGLSADLTFRLLVVAKGYAPKFVSRVEADASPVVVALALRQNTDVTPMQTARGRVVDPVGNPIAGAVVNIDGLDFGDGSKSFGSLGAMDQLAVTDDAGEFSVASNKPVAAMLGLLSARGHANQHVQLATGESHTFVMTEGATLSGRITLDGKPLANVTVGVSPQDRSSGSYVGSFEAGTDRDGKFLLPNLPPRTDYNVYGKIETLGKFGTVAARRVHVGADHSVTELGDLKVASAHHLSGRVVLSNGQELPAKARMLVGRDSVMDIMTVEIGPDGAFDLSGIPAEIITLSLRVSGYIVSPKNQSYDVGNRRLMGRVDGDIAGLELLMEPGDFKGAIFKPSPAPPKPVNSPRDRPLHGVEEQH